MHPVARAGLIKGSQGRSLVDPALLFLIAAISKLGVLDPVPSLRSMTKPKSLPCTC